MVTVIKVLFYSWVCISPSASLTSTPCIFKSFKEDYLEKNPLTKSFDLLNNYLVLFAIVFVILDIILLYKTSLKNILILKRDNPPY